MLEYIKYKYLYLTDYKFRKIMLGHTVDRRLWENVWHNVRNRYYTLNRETLKLLSYHKFNFKNFDTSCLNVGRDDMCKEMLVRRLDNDMYKNLIVNTSNSDILHILIHEELNDHEFVGRLVIANDVLVIFFTKRFYYRGLYNKPEYIGVLLQDTVLNSCCVNKLGYDAEDFINEMYGYGCTTTAKLELSKEVISYWGESKFMNEIMNKLNKRRKKR